MIKSPNIKRYPTKKDNNKSIKICEKKGTLIVLNSSTWHGSSKKITNDPRVILTLSYSRWHLRQKYAVPYGIPSKYLKKLSLKQKKILGFFNYPPKNENYRLRMRGELTSMMTR